MTQQPFIAIIILNWNGFNDTVALLESLRSLDYSNAKIVLVDNGSDNNEAQRLYERFPEVHLIANAQNRGFAGGNNDGIKWALDQGCDYIVNLNNDCLVEPDWLKNLARAVVFAEADFASSRVMCYPNTQLICSDADGLLPDGSGFVLRGMQHWNKKSEPYRIVSATGAASLYSADCVRKASIKPTLFFDELYFAYFEDVDLGFRLHAKNCIGISVPDAVVYHKGQQSSKKHSFFHLFHLEKNRRLNVLLNFPLWMQPISPLYRVARNIARGHIINFEKHFAKITARSKKPTPSENGEPGLREAVCDWMEKNKTAIAQDRQQRKAAGLISNRAYQAITWNPFKLPRARKSKPH